LLINLKGKGLTLFLLSWVPQQVEASAIALLSYYLYNIPLIIGYSLGYTLACIGPAILDMCMFRFMDRGYGKRSQIPPLLICASPIDDMICILLNGICTGVAFIEVNHTTHL
jgi:hypothetical protein